jgi:hypothetical protein
VRFDQAPTRGEALSRFIFSRSHFSPGQNRVKPGALLPSKDSLETSVFRTVGLYPPEIQRIGNTVDEPSGPTLKAWGNVLAGIVFDVGLNVRPDNVPERHAAIIGWPQQKDEQISLAQQLAEAATLHLPS